MNPWFLYMLLAGVPLGQLWLMRFPWLQGWLVAVNFLTVVAYGIDKLAAKTGQPRIPQVLLHFLAISGGAGGAAWSRRAFRHKSLKTSFDLTIWVGIASLWTAALLWAGDA